jgi:fructose-bisphosphate aldolase class 1
MAQGIRMEEAAKELVIARLETMPPNIGIAVGSEGSFSRDELIERILNNDEVGKKFVEMDMEFLRALKDGSLFE